MAVHAVSRLNWAEKLVIATSGVTLTLDFTAVAPVLPKMQEAFEPRYPNASLLVKMMVGVLGVAVMAGCLLGGWLARHFDHRRLLASALLIYAVGGSFALFGSDLYLLLLSRGVVGLVSGIVCTAAMVMLAERVHGDELNQWIGAITSTSLIVSVISYPVAGWLGNVNWRLPYTLYLASLPLALSCFAMRYTPRAESHVPAKTHALRTVPLSLVILALMVGLMGSVTLVYLPFHFQEMGIRDSRVISLSLMGYSLIGAVVALSYGRARRSLDIHQSLGYALFLTAIGQVVVALSTNVIGTLCGILLFGCGLAWLAPNLNALTSLLPDVDQRAAAFGLTKAIMEVAALFGVLMFEPINHVYGADGVLLATAACAILMLLYVLLRRGSFSDSVRSGHLS